MSEAFAALIHGQLSSQDKPSAQYFRPGQALTRLVGRRLGGDRHTRRESDDANIRVSHFFGNVARESANAVFGHHIGTRTARPQATAAVKVDDMTAFSLRHMRDDMLGAE